MSYPMKIAIMLWLGCAPVLSEPLFSKALLAQEPSAQQDFHKQMEDAMQFEQQGQYSSAIGLITHVMESAQLSAVELGRANVMLGFTNRAVGNFVAAENAFERALRILEHEPNDGSDYAAALQNYAGLYSELGEHKPAREMWKKALNLRLQLGEHAQAARTLLDLAGLELTENRINQARNDVDTASREMKLANGLPGDDRIAFLETDALLELRKRHAATALAGFRGALELCIRTHGEQHWLTGWEHVLLGSAYSQIGDVKSALANMQVGLMILKHSLGERSPKSVWAQVVYSQVLDRAGRHAEAAQVRAAVQRTHKDLYGGQCAGCTINAAGFR
jgi:tetratricopeptide (TPR) repeat protein